MLQLGQVLTDSLAKKARASSYAFDAKMHAWTASATLPATNNNPQKVLFVKVEHSVQSDYQSNLTDTHGMCRARSL
jgi:hypothetical protein